MSSPQRSGLIEGNYALIKHRPFPRSHQECSYDCSYHPAIIKMFLSSVHSPVPSVQLHVKKAAQPQCQSKHCQSGPIKRVSGSKLRDVGTTAKTQTQLELSTGGVDNWNDSTCGCCGTKSIKSIPLSARSIPESQKIDALGTTQEARTSVPISRQSSRHLFLAVSFVACLTGHS